MEIVGRTFENKSLVLLKLGSESKQEKPAIFIDAGIHAREWISPATVLWYIHQIFDDFKNYEKILKTIDIYIVPLLNPDGYQYSRKHFRYWRKNRAVYDSDCVGVDLNRNFPYHWGEAASDQCGVEIYQGPKSESEKETKILEKVLKRHKKNYKAYLTVHSYAGMILYPWGYAADTLPPDVEDLVKLGHRMADAMEAATGQYYKVQNSADLYPASGASDDYAKSLGIKYSYTIEISGQDFVENEENIPKKAAEIKAAFDTVIQQVIDEFA
uniref:Peptidase M14 carboxypeptidase A domain-containing protein n=1 Tax=Panagrolaimus sp. JU765 TaxID=591449 RepID=A0AC34Q182_9BILA